MLPFQVCIVRSLLKASVSVYPEECLEPAGCGLPVAVLAVNVPVGSLGQGAHQVLKTLDFAERVRVWYNELHAHELGSTLDTLA